MQSASLSGFCFSEQPGFQNHLVPTILDNWFHTIDKIFAEEDSLPEIDCEESSVENKLKEMSK